MKHSKHSLSPVAIRTTIRKNGLRSTASRVAVLQHMQVAITPLSHAELFDALDDKGFDRATIYRNLTDLTEAGLLLRTDVGDHVWRFELRRERQRGHQLEHPHFMCTDCGEVSCLPGASVRITPTSGMPRAVNARSVQVQFKGRCDRCAA